MFDFIAGVLKENNLDFTPVKNGKELLLRCPFHKERTPSFFINSDTGAWNCFGCKASGASIVSFIKKLTGKVIDISKYLDEFDMWKIKEKRVIENWNDRELLRLDHKSHKIIEMKRLEKEYMDDFPPASSSLLAMDYLKGDKRKLTKQTVDDFGLKYALSGDYQSRVIIPFTKDGYFFGFSARDITGNSSKRYLFNVDNSTLRGFIYNANRTKGDQYCVLVEGPFDLMWCHQIGVRNVISTLSTGILLEHIEYLSRFKKIIFMFDNDENKSGYNSMLKGASLIKQIIPSRELFYAKLPEFKDPNSCTKEEVFFSLNHLKSINLSKNE